MIDMTNVTTVMHLRPRGLQECPDEVIVQLEVCSLDKEGSDRRNSAHRISSRVLQRSASIGRPKSKGRNDHVATRASIRFRTRWGGGLSEGCWAKHGCSVEN